MCSICSYPLCHHHCPGWRQKNTKNRCISPPGSHAEAGEDSRLCRGCDFQGSPAPFLPQTPWVSAQWSISVRRLCPFASSWMSANRWAEVLKLQERDCISVPARGSLSHSDVGRARPSQSPVTAFLFLQISPDLMRILSPSLTNVILERKRASMPLASRVAELRPIALSTPCEKKQLQLKAVSKISLTLLPANVCEQTVSTDTRVTVQTAIKGKEAHLHH